MERYTNGFAVKMRFPILLQIRIDPELYETLVARATKDKTTVSHLVRSVCRKAYVRNQNE